LTAINTCLPEAGFNEVASRGDSGMEWRFDMFKRILVAVDGSPASNAGLHSAVAFAADQKATLLTLHVVDDALPINFEGAVYPPSYVDSYYAAISKGGQKILDKANAAGRAQDVQTESSLVQSRGRSVADVIVAQARKLRADAIVLGTHGRRGLKRALMGSDAEDVVRQADVPVMLVHGRVKRKAKSPSASKRPASSDDRRSAAAAR